MEFELTDKQKEAVVGLLMRRNTDGTPFYSSVGPPAPCIFAPATVVMKCNYASGNSIFIVIESDGHTHS